MREHLGFRSCAASRSVGPFRTKIRRGARGILLISNDKIYLPMIVQNIIASARKDSDRDATNEPVPSLQTRTSVRRDLQQ